jgi:hypothetical protein
MITDTPNFKTFEININSQGWQPAPAKFTWRLLPSALNTLEMRSVNVLGKHGKPSKLKLFWHYRAPYSPRK